MGQVRQLQEKIEELSKTWITFLETFWKFVVVIQLILTLVRLKISCTTTTKLPNVSFFAHRGT